MKLKDFIQKKYGNKFVDQKEAIKAFNQNEKNKKKYFALKRAKKTGSFDFKMLEKDIIW